MPPAPDAGGSPRSVAPRGFAEPLTDREVTVLRYLRGTLSNAEIAGLLYVSINTLKTHVKNVYRKLGTGGRRDAVARGERLGPL